MGCITWVRSSYIEWFCSCIQATIADRRSTRKTLDFYNISHFTLTYWLLQLTGLEQRIDGTETERDAIADVISRMVEYFYGEVLTKEVYEGVRDKW